MNPGIDRIKMGNRILRMRKENGWSQEKLASQCGAGINTSTIQKLENATQTSDNWGVLQRVADTFSVELAKLISCVETEYDKVFGEFDLTDGPTTAPAPKEPDVEDVKFLSSELSYTHVVTLMGQKYIIKNRKDISPERVEDTAYDQKMVNEKGDLITGKTKYILGLALGEHIKKIKQYKPSA